MSSSFLQSFKSSTTSTIPRWLQNRVGSTFSTPIIQRIDDDALISIFIATLKIAHCDNAPMSRTHPVVVITHVCRRWRTLALAVEALWTKIHLVIPPYPQGRWANHIDHALGIWKIQLSQCHQMTEAWISRSGGSRLHVKVSEKSSYPPFHLSIGTESHPELASLVNTLVQTSLRWKELELELTFVSSQTPEFPTARFLSLPPQIEPVLTHVRLHMSMDRTMTDLLLSKPSMLGGTALRSLAIGGLSILHDLGNLPMSWCTLKHLDLRGYSSLLFNQARALQVFRLCPNLVSCYVSFTNDPDHSLDLGESITLPFLEDLKIRTSEWDIPKGFGPVLILPSLRKLTVECLADSWRRSPLHYSESGLCEFTERFGSTLHHANFYYIALTQEALRQCLGNLPRVVSLTLTDSPNPWLRDELGDFARINAELFQALTPHFNVVKSDSTETLKFQGQPFCPMMEELILPTPPLDKGSEMALVDLIYMRRKAWSIGRATEERVIARLKTITWDGCWVQTRDLAVELHKRAADDHRFSTRDLVDSIRSIKQRM